MLAQITLGILAVLLLALSPLLSAGEVVPGQDPAQVDVSPAFDYLDMVQGMRDISVVYREEVDSENPNQPERRFSHKRIMTLSLGESAWRLDERPDYTGWKDANTPPLNSEEMAIDYIRDDVTQDFSISQTSNLFSFLDRKEKSMVVYSYPLDRRGDMAFKEAQFDEITSSKRMLHSVLLPLRYAPSESLSEYGHGMGLWSFRSKAFIATIKKRLLRSFVNRAVVPDKDNEVWFNYRAEIKIHFLETKAPAGYYLSDSRR